MTDIQQARDILAKWRANATAGMYSALDLDGAPMYDLYSRDDDLVGEGLSPFDAALIVGTAGNPELLDAIDALLYAAVITAQLNQNETALQRNAERIAAKIVAAEERMSA